MARLKAAAKVPVPAGGVPAELLLGPCVEVWAADGRSLLDARMRYVKARNAWLRQNGYHPQHIHDLPEGLRVARGPYSRVPPRVDPPPPLALGVSPR